MSETTRRGVLAGAAGVGAAAVLAACGTASDNSNTGSSNNGGTQSTPTGTAPTKATPTAGQTQGGSTGGGAELAKTTEIPVGGGKVIEAQKVVVTQPTKGNFKAFSAVCTHAGCTVGSVSNGVISCPCHGSRFSAADGSVKGGPAPSALAAKNVTVQGDSITLA
jgi:Rieske Fe-S protein